MYDPDIKNKIVDYQILSSTTTDELSEDVIELMREGYRLAGGVSYSGLFFVQALYRNDFIQ